MPLIELDLQNLNGQDGFVINGKNRDDRVGRSAARVGDINGDGIEDFILGAPYADVTDNYNYEGQAYVIFGSNEENPPSLDVATLDGQNGFAISGFDSSDNVGFSVGGNGDINGDGIDDVVIGTNYAGSNTAFVVFGSDSEFAPNLSLSTLNGSNGFTLQNAAYARRIAVDIAGDINGDGFSDVIIGAPNTSINGSFSVGQAYIIFGGNNLGATVDLSSLNGINGFDFNGLDGDDNAGQSVSRAGDVNGDGFDDFIIGASGAGTDVYFGYQGRAYVVFGNGDAFDNTLNPNVLNGTNGFTLLGVDNYDNAGFAVSQAGDVNGDGIDDILITAPNTDNANSYDRGTVYVVYGTSNGFDSELDLSTLDGESGFAINGVNRGDQVGRAVSGGFDFNGDGIDDIAIGAPYADSNGNNSGEAYVILGGQTFGASVDLATFDGDGFIFRGLNRSDNLGRAISGLGDVNGDNVGDLLIGAPGVNDSSGQGIIVFGTKTENLTGSSDDDILTGGSLSDRLAGRGGDDVLRGRGGSDTLLGGSGNDTILGSIGNDSLAGNAGDDQLLGESGHDKINGGGGRDFMDGGQGSDTLLGGNGSDRLLGDTGNDSLRGNAGFDRLFGEAGNDTLDGGIGNDTIQGGQGDDLITSAVGNNRLLGNAGDDQFQVKRGSNNINGGDGTDTLDYGSITQSLEFDLTGTVQKGNLGTDTISNIETVIGSTSNQNEINGSSLIDAAVNIDLNNSTVTVLSTDAPIQYLVENFVNVTGSDLADVIEGSNADNEIDGAAGDDTLVASTGDDKLLGGSGEDQADYSSLGRSILFNVLGSVQKGTQGTDTLESIETIVAGGVGSTVDGSSLTEDGFTLQVDLADELSSVLDETSSSEVIFTVTDFNQVIGGDNDDRLLGNSRRNTLEGGAGSDFLSGRGGADTLIGVSLADPMSGPQSDTLIGGNGNDLFVLGDENVAFYVSDGDADFAQIGDFRSGRDRIQLNGVLEDYLFSGGASNTSIFSDQNDNGVLDQSDDLIATFTAGGFQTSDLLFV